MVPAVIDASVTASWLLPDEADEATRNLYEQVAAKGAYVPALWDYEIRNILIVNQRRGRITAHAANAAFDFLADLNILRDHATDRSVAVRLCRTFSLTVYDAAYLELSIRLDLELATFDKALASAARKTGNLSRHSPFTP